MPNNAMKGQSEAAEAMTALRATYAEVHPHRNPEAMQIDDVQLALVVMLRREVRAAAKAGLTPRDLDRIARHNPKDGE